MPTRAIRPYAHDHVARRLRIDSERANDPIRKLYRSPAWRKLRQVVIQRDWVCKHCGAERVVIADHIVRARKYIDQHGGDQDAFFDLSNIEGLCKPCHDTKTARECGFAGSGK